MSYAEQRAKIANNNGFIAALDQSGGSTPKALKQYGIEETAFRNEDEMFDLVHQMRTRIITAPAFNGEKVIGAILFEKTMDNSINGTPTAQYLWEKLGVVPFLKIDKGLADEMDGVQIMKPMPDLSALLKRAKAAGIFGTKMRSVINTASASGIAAVVAQQFEVASQILDHGLMPIIEPEVNIKAADKEACEEIMKAEILKHLNTLPEGREVMLKLTLPETANFYADLIAHPKVLRVVALSGGYSLEESCKRLSENDGMIASFSRALSNDLRASQSDAEFNSTLSAVIDKIYAASVGNGAKSQAA
ncbi:MAG: fructose bisphosphate aldolase [Alphaproteobacteria bacterium]|nr:fructose bisphosphate aldolase [Alphaproteobacteria bacterium]MCD8570576.1 fructose bisphosphate aldolase [Alphaproteobacteria bacterium]